VVDQSPLRREGIVGNEAILPVAILRTNAAALGSALPLKDSDGVVRRHFVETELQPSLPWVAARLAGAASLSEYHRLEPRWLRYYGSVEECLPRLGYAEALRMPAGTFTGKYVFIGGSPWIKKPGEQSDMFRTPYSRWALTEAAGVDLVALNFLNLLRGEALRRLGVLSEFLWFLSSCLLMAAVFWLSRRWTRLLWLLLSTGASVAAAFLLLAWGHVWFCWLGPILIQLPLGLLGSWLCAQPARRMGPSSSKLAAGDAALFEAAPAPAVVLTSGLPQVADHTLLRRVGTGAYGEVWLARNAVGILHAVKVIHRRAFESSEPFEREFRGITRFMPISRSHPGFVHVLQVGPEEVVDYFYYVMELADDVQSMEVNADTYEPKNLSNLLKRRRRLHTAECLQLGLHMTDALSRLHHAQLIHRDIKPSNIIFVRGLPKLADIGLVTRIAAGPREVSFLGTRGYIPPEGPGTPSADIFSLGKVLYEVYSGMDREQFPSLPTSLLEAPGPGLAALNQVVLRACELDPQQRYQSAAEFHRELLALQTQVVAERPVDGGGGESPGPPLPQKERGS
jgi:hypothetical protein